MIALVGAILGFFGSAVPEIIKYFKVKQDYAHEKEMYQLQVESMKTEHEYKMREVEAEADIRESEALYKASEIKLTGWKVVDGIIMLYNSSVRPTVTYCFCIFYGLAKFGQYQMIKASSSAGATEVIWKLFNEEDMALFSTVLAFWFGARSMRHLMDAVGVGVNGGSNVQALKPKI